MKNNTLALKKTQVDDKEGIKTSYSYTTDGHDGQSESNRKLVSKPSF